VFKVLLVEDNEAVRLVMSKQLSLEGLQVTVAETGDEALEIAATDRDFDVAILDFVLPGTLEGLDLVKALRKECHGIGIIHMSGHSVREPELEADHQYDVFLCKPIRRNQLIDAVYFAYQAGCILKRGIA
jgi:two-component system alkaline phosphatase synthesis response regulator PhoP